MIDVRSPEAEPRNAPETARPVSQGGLEVLYEEIARQAALRCDTAFAAITLGTGLLACMGLKGREREDVERIVAHALLESVPFLVGDLREDGRFATLPLVTEAPFVRAFASAPILSGESRPLGMICVLDGAPGEPDVSSLQTLATAMGELLEARRLIVEGLGPNPHPQALRDALDALYRLLLPLFESLCARRADP